MAGSVFFIKGSRKAVAGRMAELSVEGLKMGGVLFIDSMNCLNPHHPAYRGPLQEDVLRGIYCARAPKPHDLYARMRASAGFIRRNSIRTLLVSSITTPFDDACEQETPYLARRIVALAYSLSDRLCLEVHLGCPDRRDGPGRSAQAVAAAFERHGPSQASA